MKINNTYEIKKKHDGTIITNLIDNRYRGYNEDHDLYNSLKSIVTILRNRSISDERKNQYLVKRYDGMAIFTTEESKLD